ncbi:FERM domain-containing protein [Caenorhabditis elegans]|uniref:FERM domain-containing protein n=1 Tax=Caenorhabditis elegans TaxID=6239 RepID=H2KYX2_CAEEL|nr:FERM domain-containing protein [Caenorhabditis elegans]CCD65309.1 FERM domain-containing protein [Caenorhabditis elegans]|eukprot:NP_498335.1 NeuroFibroMatosis homolog [Caenorhabditis elegans]
MGGFSIFSRNTKPIYAKVSTMDADLEKIVIEKTWTGRHLFEAVCRIIGLRETWYFGLQFTNKKNIPCWLQNDKTICGQDIQKDTSDGTFNFLFLVKFYPEDVEPEIILDATRHLFFLQIREAILSMNLYCSPEASVLLASFAVQAMHGDCTEEVGPIDLDKHLPKSVIDQYDMSADMWRDRIKRWWSRNAGQSREEAELEYLRVAQDLEMYGILYYPICNNKETDLHLGISAQGLGIYKGVNRITPRPFFSWSEIKNIQFKNRKFHMKTVDKSTISFRSRETSIDSSILDLCIGTHNLYLRRRQPDTLEVQQMRSQAKEDKQRRAAEQAKVALERKERQQMEKEYKEMKQKVEVMTLELMKAQENIRKAEEANDQLAEKARHSEHETLMLYKQKSEVEAECNRLSMNNMKSEEALLRMERKAREAEILAKQMSMSLADVSLDANRKMTQYSSQSALIIDPNWHQQVSGHQSGHPGMPSTGSFHQLQSLDTHTHPQQMMSRSLNMPSSAFSSPIPSNQPLSHQQPQQMSQNTQAHQQQTQVQNQNQPPYYGGSGMIIPPPDPSISQIFEQQTTLMELEKSRSEYETRARIFKEHLEELRGDIDGLKRDGNVQNGQHREHDAVHAQNVAHGFDKFTTMRMSMRGTPRQRAQAFDGM